MDVTRHLANFLTLLNLLAGVFALLFVFQGQYWMAFYLVLAGIAFDFADGLVARATHTSSELGLQLDSLADLVTSGVVPSFFLFRVLQEAMPGSAVPYLALIIPAASAWRLAVFNLDTRQRDRFVGLPTPANALFLIGIALSIRYYPDFVLTPYYSLPVVSTVIILLSAWLLNAAVELIALKFKDFSLKNNLNKYILLLAGGLILALWGIPGIPVILAVYVLISLVSKPR